MSTLLDASIDHSPSRMRYLFIFLLSLGTVLNSQQLYQEHRAALLDDYLRRSPERPELAEALLLWELQRLSQLFDFEFRDLHWVEMPAIRPEDVDVVLANETLRTLGEQNYSLLNVEQKAAVDAVEASVFGQSAQTCFFLTGPAGTGKTFVYQTLYYRLVGQGKNVLSVAYSGIAASLLLRGQTAHSAFKLKLNMVPDEPNLSSL